MSKRIICSLIVAAMALSSCTFSDDAADTASTDTTAAETDAVTSEPNTGLAAADVAELRGLTAASSANINVSGAAAAYFFSDHYNAFTSSMASALEKNGFDENKPLGEQFYEDGKSWLGYYQDSTRTYMSHYIALCESAAVNGVSLTDDELAALRGRTERGVRGKYGENLSADDIFEAVKLEALATKLTVIKEAELMPSESEMLTYAEANTDSYSYPTAATVNVRHVLFSTDTYGSAEAALAKANEVMAQIGDADAETVALLALEYSDDASNCYRGGAYTNLAKGKTNADFNKWCFDETRAVGDIEVIETEYGAHIMYFEGAGLPKWQGEISEIMIDKEFNAICSMLYAKYPVTFDDAVIAKIAK